MIFQNKYVNVMYNFSREKILNFLPFIRVLRANPFFRQMDFPPNGFSAKWIFREMDFPRNGFSAIRIGAQ